MDFAQLQKTIKNISWWEEKAPAAYHCVAQIMHAFIEQSRYFHPKYLTIAVLPFQDDFFYEETPEQEKYEVYKYIFNKSKINNRYLALKKRQVKKRKKFVTLGQYFGKNKHKLSNQKFWRIYESFMQSYIDFLRFGAAWECVDVFTAYYLEPLVADELPAVPEAAAREITSLMAMPAHLSFIEQERRLFLEICLGLHRQIKKRKKISLSDISSEKWLKEITRLQKLYFWTRNSFAQTRVITREQYFLEITEEIRKNSYQKLKNELASLNTKTVRLRQEHHKISAKYHFSPDLRLHLFLVRYFGELIDDRKQHMLIASHFITLFCEELARRFAINIWEVKYYLYKEVKNLLLNGRRLDQKIAKARRKLSVYAIVKHGHQAIPTIYYGRQARQIFKAFKLGVKIKSMIVTGQVASAPVKKMTGVVQVVMDVNKQKFSSGNILVTTMTRPDFIPYLRRAKAVITDEGGLTCHAAIISRELKKPCIIGCKVATRVLKTGDRVEMDMEQGIVRKLKSSYNKVILK
ncbi:MAG: PEP-utilizing enzyme [Patescibacteria group bacterium]|jgi:phosphohistidine swiveling domain-containing protein